MKWHKATFISLVWIFMYYFADTGLEILMCLIPGVASDLFGMLSDIWFMHHIYALLKSEMFWILKPVCLPGLQIRDCGLQMLQYVCWLSPTRSPLLTPGSPCRSSSPSLDSTIVTVPRLHTDSVWPVGMAHTGSKAGPSLHVGVYDTKLILSIVKKK